MKRFSVSILVALLPISLAQLVGDDLFFSFTYRDFLPGNCFFGLTDTSKAQEWRDAWAITNTGQPSNTDGCQKLRDDPVWKAALDSEQISGHPDFEASGGNTFSGGQICKIAKESSNGVDFPTGFCEALNSNGNNVNMILRDLAVGTNGLPKPVYCKSGENDQCGFTNGNRKTQTRNKFFQSWFNDDVKFNRRVGQRLKLTRENPNSERFFFTSDSQNSEPDESPDSFLPGFFGPLNRFHNLGYDDFAISDYPAWPQSDPDNIVQTDDEARILFKKFWYTTELHTTFQFNSEGDMTFSFSGDDDFWAFVNGKMIVALSGTHGIVGASVDLNSKAGGFDIAAFLGLEDGKVYTLDIFHAERQQGGSNFEMTTSLAPACNVLQSGSVRFSLSQSVDPNAFVTRGFSLTQNRFDLLREGVIGQSRSIFTKNVLNLEKGFVASFTVDSTGPAEGFAFVVQAEGVDDLIASGGNTFNMQIKNSFAVVFDLCVDRDEVGTTCQERNVRLHYPDNFEEKNSALDESTLRVFDRFFMRSLDRANDRMKVEIIYFGGNPDFLEIFIDGSLYLRQDNFFLDDVIGTFGAHVGLTASTATITGGINIQDFKVESVDRAASETIELFDRDELEPESIPADGTNATEGLSFQTKDLCGDNVNSGGLADEFDIVFVEQLNENGTFFGNKSEPSVIRDTRAEDNGDGTYTIRLSTELPGTYSFFATFGGPECKIVEDKGTVTLPNDSLDCFISQIPKQFIVVPLDDGNGGVDVEFQEGSPFNFVPIAGAGGGLLVLSAFGLILFVYYRNKWKSDQKHVQPGADFRMQQALNVGGGEEYTEVGKQVLRSQQELLELKNMKSAEDRSAEIAQLQERNKEMKNVISASKKQMESTPQLPPSVSSKAKAKKDKYKRADF